MKVIQFGAGFRTYVIAAGLILNALTPFLLGEAALGDIDMRSILEGLGLATLRAGVGK